MQVKSRSGFTLTEIVVTIVVIGTLAGLTLPKITNQVEKVKSGEGTKILQALLDAQRIYEFENGSYADDLDDLDVEFGAPENFDALTDANISTANPVATITRTGDYTLSIDTDGTIKCINEVTAGICARMGCVRGGGTECN
ncbi:MAG: type II secretion system GspH family protein [Candidatus Omnitrophica bacterium]|nr:type II secretion system GspH family protein [Candidatus Omnitrophota bacterium]MBU1995684.1 type II secretion system GspH family protein [Candidatus Omnitrophota bacterium]MBU4333023.1 type II secretion system GspH family protein [Candidatus Omnitrophota bacterium]